MHVKPAGKAAMIFAVVAIIGVGAWKSGVLDKVPTPTPVVVSAPITEASTPEPTTPVAVAAPATVEVAPAPAANVTNGDAGMAALLNAGKKK